MLHYTGSNFLRQRLVLSTISGRPILISDIRVEDENPGIRDYEMSLLKLLDAITDGSQFSIDETGTKLKYKPGMLLGGDSVTHECPVSRCVTYFLEVLLMLGPFCKAPLEITLRGITNRNGDISIDTFRTVTLPMLRHVNISEGLGLKINKRGCLPLGGGEVVFSCPIVRLIQPFQLLEPGRIKRVRGVAYNTRLAQQFSTRAIDKARNVLNDFLPDVWIYSDVYKNDRTGLSPGYGLSLVAETMKGFSKGADFAFDPTVTKLFSSITNSAEKRSTNLNHLIQSDDVEEEREEEENNEEDEQITEPELVGRLCATRLLWEIEQGGVVDTSHQHYLLYFMALADEHTASKISLSKLSLPAVQMIRHIKDFLGTNFDINDNLKENTTLITGVGVGVSNINKNSF